MADTDEIRTDTEPLLSVSRTSSSANDESEPDQNAADTPAQSWNETMSNKVRIMVGFWLLGVCNNFGYVVMLSAAYDILESDGKNDTHVDACQKNETLQTPHSLVCNKAGTGVVLLADILPTLFIKFTAPFYMHKISYNVRVFFTCLFNLGSFLLVALAGSHIKWLSILGVVFASIASGFGEIIFLSLSSYFPSHTISSWASGTGAAGIFGAVTYSGLTQLGVSPKNTLLIMLFIPVLEAFSYFWMIVKPQRIQSSWKFWNDNQIAAGYEQIDNRVTGARNTTKKNEYTVKQMITLMQSYAVEFGNHFGPRLRPLLKYMIPLGCVYMAEYFINQALFELAYFPGACSWLEVKDQYRWFQTIYQVGVFVSRSSVLFFKLKLLWILPILQFANLLLIMCQVIYHYMPENGGIWIMFALILWEGTLGGMGYVHTFYQISQKVDEEHKEFSMGVASCADTTGIVISAFVSIAAHNGLCNMSILWS